MTRNLRLKLSFLGKRYHGWQLQNNAPTVSGEVIKALNKIFGSVGILHGVGRTDAGVHAKEFYCNFKTESDIPVYNVVKAMNFYLPRDISVLECAEVDLNFHSRYDCKGKEYIYRFLDSPERDPFLNDTAYHYFKGKRLNENIMNDAAKFFLGEHDFSAFCSSGTSVKNFTRNIKNSEVIRMGDVVIFKAEGDGFLYNMVRIMAGSLVLASEEKISPPDIKEIIEKKDRNNSGNTLPAHGLILNRVFY